MLERTARPAVDAVVFDVGGVLLDWNPEYLYSSLIPDQQERRHFLTEVCNREWNAAQDAGRPWEEAVAERIERFPEYADLIAAYDERWEEMVSGPIPGMDALVRQLRRQTVSLYVLSNISLPKWLDAVDRWDFLRGLNGAIISGAEGVVKPQPAIYRTLLDRYALDATRTFFADDLSSNVEAARGLGIDAEVFHDAETVRHQLASRGIAVGE